MKVLLVDDEPNVLRGIQRMIQSQKEDWDVEIANTGIEALGILETESYDVIVSDIRMPEMDGVELLQTVENRYPNILRIVLSGQIDRESLFTAIKPMHQYLAKPCKPAALIDAIRRAETFHETIMSPEVLIALGRANCLPALPTIIVEINEMLSSPHCTSKSLAGIIVNEAGLCGRILQLANAPIFGLNDPVYDLEHAISIIGTEMIEALALSTAVFSEENPEVAERANRVFEHSVRMAEIGRLLVRENGLSDLSNIVTSSCLLHDLGKIVLLNSFGERYRTIEENCQSTGQPLYRAEFEELGATHAGVGAHLLQLWGLPDEIVESVGAHHSFEICSRSNMAVKIVFAANWISHDKSGLKPQFSGSTLQSESFLEQLFSWKTLYLNVMEQTSHA